MRPSTPSARARRGTILPLIAFCCIALFGFMALAIDLGVIAAAKAQAQNAADSAAMAGARTLDGRRPAGTASDAPITVADNNYANAAPNARTAAVANTVLGKAVTTSQTRITIGKLVFDATQSKFFKMGNDAVPLERAQINNWQALDGIYSWSLAHARVTHSNDTFFGRMISNADFSVTATAAAVHRPRDVMVVMDYSTSMSNDSMLGLGRWGDANVQVNGGPLVPSRFAHNPDTAHPKWGHYRTFNLWSTASFDDAKYWMRTPDDLVTVRQPGAGATRNEAFQASNWTAPHASNKNRIPLLTGFYAVAATDPANPPASAFVAAGAGDAMGRLAGDDASLVLKNDLDNGPAPRLSTAELPATGDPIALPRDAAWETSGYGASFKGYARGPGYYGKTFWMWPPDPRPDKDWRRRFFIMKNPTTGAWDTPLDDNSLLFDPRGNFRSPRYRAAIGGGTPIGIPIGWPNGVPTVGDLTYAINYPPVLDPVGTDQDYYRINYEEIFRWMHSNPDPFPSALRAGRIVYYTSKISNPPAGLNARFWADNTGAFGGYNQHDLLFWKQFVDHALGLEQTNANTWRMVDRINAPSVSSWGGYGGEQAWGTIAITPKSLITPDAGGTRPYMAYGDNPKRPKLGFWFGPIMMVDSFYNQNLGRYRLAGTVREQPLFACKVGIQGGLKYIEKNHPNDMVGLIFFNGDRGRFPRPRVALGKDYTRMINSLWYPPNKIASGYNPSAAAGSANGPIWWDEMPNDTPHANGGTNYTFPLMLAYNQYSEDPVLRSFNPNRPVGDAGGNGRRGAQKLIIFITDGQPNNGTSTSNFVPQLQGNGANHSYYSIRYRESGGSSDGYTGDAGDGSFNNSTLRTQIYGVANQICADMSDSNPGFSTPRKPVMIHCIGFGQLFESNTPERQNALVTFKEVERIGKVWGPGTDNATYENQSGEAITAWKCIYGTDDEVNEKLVEAISRVTRSGFQLSLVE